MYEAFAKTFAAFIGPVLRWLRPLNTQKAAGEKPERFRAIDQTLFDNVFRRLSVPDPIDPIFKRTYDVVTSSYCTPDFLRTKSVQVSLQICIED